MIFKVQNGHASCCTKLFKTPIPKYCFLLLHCLCMCHCQGFGTFQYSVYTLTLSQTLNWTAVLYDCMCQLLRKISILQHGPDVGIRTMRCCVCNSAFLPHLYTFQLEDCLSNDLVKCAEKKIHNFFLIIWDNTADKFFKLYLSLVLFKMVIEQSNTQDQLMSEVTYYRQ